MDKAEPARLIRVLVVDDSAFLRKVVAQMLSRSPFIEVVGAARDGEEALEMAERLRPDVITLDLVMPGMDGPTFLQEQMARRPVPVVVCSIAHESGELAIRAMDAGAVEFVQKPTALATEKVFEMADDLVAKVKAAATARLPRLQHISEAPADAVLLRPPRTGTRPGDEILVIGVSTGGPQALRHLIPLLPADLDIPVAIVLHMPIGYTQMYARRLNEICALEVVEAGDHEPVLPGKVYLAPAGKHLSLVRQADGTVRTHLDLRPFDTRHRPAVDVLFQSASETYGAHVLGLVMTGMGEDGLRGSAHIKGNGGRIITEAESSCVVYGMPRAVKEAALSDRSVTLEEMAQTVLEMLYDGHDSGS